MHLRTLGTRVAVAALLVVVASRASANPYIYGDFLGANLDFLSVSETVNTGEPDPLFGGVLGPQRVGNQLLWFPTSFSSSSANGSADNTSSTLNMILESKNGETMDSVTITELGDYLLGGVGTTATSASISGLLTVTVTHINGAPVPGFPPFILLTDSLDIIDPPGASSPFQLGVDPNSDEFTAVMSVLLPAGTTRLIINMNNNLATSSEPGTSALIEKKFVGGPAVIFEVNGPIIPEPSTLALLGTGLLMLSGVAFRRRRR